MHKTGFGQLGSVAVGIMLSFMVNAADQTQPAAPQPATTQNSADATSAGQPAAGEAPAQTPAAPATEHAPTADAAPRVPDNGGAPAKPPATQPDGAPAKPPAAQSDGTPAKPPAAQSDSAPAKSAPADKTAAAQDGVKKPGSEKRTAADKPSTAAKSAAAEKDSAKKTAPVDTFAIAPCPDLNATQVAALIQQDYTQNRLPHPQEDDKTLGGDTAVVTIDPEAIIGTGDSWQAPMTVRGPSADRRFAVSLDCQKAEIRFTPQP